MAALTTKGLEGFSQATTSSSSEPLIGSTQVNNLYTAWGGTYVYCYYSGYAGNGTIPSNSKGVAYRIS